MEAEEAERVLRTVHKAATRAGDRLESEIGSSWRDAWRTDAAPARAVLKDIPDEFDASVASVMAGCAELVSKDHPYPDPDATFALNAILRMRSPERNIVQKAELLELARPHLGFAIDDLDNPSGEKIGGRPPGPGFYQGDQSVPRRAEAGAGEQRNATTPSGLNSVHDGSVSEVAGPYSDLREPWYRRLLRRNRGDGSPR
ncbi:hypothetical protein HZZ00_28875 [Streptomyces sp. NEAU-sy36]|uniref:hypothetical protein n=1 Tax=unclassified Streptomyces TaxID=2593676 RepID=UPI0015D5778D|nr:MULTISPECIES: hypothetical protein [unclassified Streptomyces]QLJ04624.1 hypothetical protein HZZ00_28875 [Streptomyces sp. NEAU-sy36]